MPCPNCGHENPAESLFCGSCGTTLAAGEAGAGQDPTAVDTFSEAGPPTAAATGIAAGSQPWGTDVNEPVPATEATATWQEPDPTTAMPPTTAIPAAGAVAAAGGTAAIPATGAIGGQPPGSPPGPPLGSDPDERSNRGWIIAIVVLALLLVAAIIAFFVTRDSSTTTTPTTSSTSSTSTSTTSTSSTSTSTTSTSTTSTTRPSTTTTSTTAPTTTTTAPTTTTTAPKPSITTFTVPATVTQSQCASGTAQITISWATTNTSSVTIGIGNPQPYEQNLPATGSLQVPFVCSNGTNTYYITAFGSDGSTSVQSKNATYTPSP